MDRIRVLVIDDSAVARRVISDLLAEDPAIEVAGTAAHGRVALAKIPQLKPDLVTLDLEMPEMDGLQMLAVLRKDHPALPVIVLSSMTARGAAITLESLTLGARDYITKPAGFGAAEAESARREMQHQLIARIKAFARPGTVRSTPVRVREVEAPAFRRAEESPRSAVKIVVVGASTGGPNALAEVLSAFGGPLAVPLLIAQHMPPVFTRALAERLADRTKLRVEEARDGQVPVPGLVLIAPGDFHMEVRREGLGEHLSIRQGAPENGCRPSVDVLFRSAADAYGPGVLGIVLTGMGHDGLKGGERIRAAGGRLLVQDEASSVVWGMPGAVARAGLAEDAFAPAWMGREIARRSRHGGAAS
jgi:two-component system chemotaxis response regulator CheB